ncbi:MAG: BREX-3 system phosphatase PglZ [Chloroflexi bacterium]|nr:BREX-3 system phosphatase PglZ [Chloroflexota bacterium]
MLSNIISLFPAHTHSLTLISDPDGLLTGEAVMLELSQRGFQVIQENDPVLLRQRVERARPFSPQQPLLLITNGPLEDLPYDLYQQAYRLTLSLHNYFPNLAYPVLQNLNPEQLEKLTFGTPIPEILSRQKTIDYLLREVFNADALTLSQPHALIAWLNDYHQRQSPLPLQLRQALLEKLKRYPAYHDWDLELLIRETQAFVNFVQQQWQESIDQTLSGNQTRETGTGYSLPFTRDINLQNLVPALVRQGTLQPIKIPTQKGLPAWTQSGITQLDARLQRVTFLIDDLDGRLKTLAEPQKVQTSWHSWSGLAQDWAELCSLVYQTDLATNTLQKETFRRLVREVNHLFPIWLQRNYTSLGAQRLPRPHHVHHVPHYLAHLRNLGQFSRVVLLILDGLSLTDWQVIKSVWTKRHQNWRYKTETLLAQVPTITSISRYALISGLRPADFASDLEHCPAEARAWELFWSREGQSATICGLRALSFDRGIDQLAELLDPRVSFWCLVEDTPDKLAHNATLGAVDQQSSLRLWLDPTHAQNSLQLEKLLDTYLDRGYAVFITSDHGHVEATGFGQPSEGLLAQTRGKRARIYQDRLAALRIQGAFSETILWDNDGLLPKQMVALMPSGRGAFAPSGEVVVTHGGISIDEAIVPLIQITKAR